MLCWVWICIICDCILRVWVCVCSTCLCLCTVCHSVYPCTVQHDIHRHRHCTSMWFPSHVCVCVCACVQMLQFWVCACVCVCLCVQKSNAYHWHKEGMQRLQHVQILWLAPTPLQCNLHLYQDTGNHHALRLCTLVAFQLLGINHYCACMWIAHRWLFSFWQTLLALYQPTHYRLCTPNT